MIVYFANRGMDTLGLASTELGQGFHITEDTKTEDIDTGVAVFECTIHWTPETRELAKSCTTAGNYILRSYNGEDEFYTIIEVEEDTKDRTTYIYAEDAGMDLLNETVGAFAATVAHPAEWYIEIFARDSGFEIGINEIADLSRKLEWTGEATAAERIASVATQFDNAEIGYSFEISGLVITHKYINIYAQRGKDAGVTLRLNREVDRIVTTTSVADLATSLYVTGGTPEGEEEPITITGYDYDDGDFYVMANESRLNCRSALAIWSRYVWEGEPEQLEGYTGNIVKQWSYDTTSVSELVNRAVSQLKKICEPAVNYDVDVNNMPENVGIGDYVYIVDEEGDLYMQSRILQMQTSACEQTQRLTLGDYKIDSGGLSSQVSALRSQVSSLSTSVSDGIHGDASVDSIVIKNPYANNYWKFYCNGDKIGITESVSGGSESSQDFFFYTTGEGDIYIGHDYGDFIYIGLYCDHLVLGASHSQTGINGSRITIGESSSTIYIKGSSYSSSDETLKTSIQPLSESGIDNLTPVSFKWRDGDNTTHYGYVAQDVREHIPELVKESDGGLLSLAYTEIIPLLHAKINELEDRIEKLEKEANHV